MSAKRLSAKTLPLTGPPRIFVVGGGLAGMTVAKVLAEHGRRVYVLEASQRLGGKAGAERLRPDGPVEDHGYHVFPAWYANTRQLLEDLRCDANLVDVRQYHSLRRNSYPSYFTYPDMAGMNLLQHVASGVLPWHENILSFYNALELACEPFQRRAYLDRVSATGFLRSRFYATEAVAAYHQQTVLQAVAIPTYEISAMTLQKLVRAWVACPSPVYSVLNGNLHDKFIGPYEAYLRQRGVEILTNQRIRHLMRVGDFISGFITEEGGTREQTDLVATENDVYVLATPHQKTLDILSGTTMRAEGREAERLCAPEEFGLAGLVNLRSMPMAALHIHLRRRLPNFPAGHVNLLDSRYAMNVLDVSHFWRDTPNTTLYAIASNYPPLRPLGSDTARKRALLEELFQYFPMLRHEVDDENVSFQPHEDQPLLVNTIGSWQFRPTAATGLPNLFVAGDYCRTDADLTTMESAVISGIQTARAILDQLGERTNVAPQPIPTASLPMLHALRAAAAPVIAPIGMVKWAQRQLADLANLRWW